ncbi:MAG: DNA mismatch repair endonuclease MutL [Lentisphaerota bacterium]
MGFISLLSENVFNKIAAGEVVERPSSVVKELIENSIDAGATSLRISIEKSGMKSICILDNGSGMDADDALLCFEPHATSKIRTESDIFNISTMGFRGEAMPSIASVSKVKLRTRRHDAIEGLEVIINGGKFTSESPCGCACGTEITISDLFYNVPARKKFLKGEITEEKHIFETVLLLALAHSEISFELKSDGKTIFTSSSDKSLLPRLSLLLGKEVAENSFPLNYEENNYKISGFISKPSITRSSRREQRFFVNGRPIRSIMLYSAVREAYGSLIMHGSFPSVTIFLDLSASDIDVNVHPAKLEVRFKHERLISELVIKAIRQVLYPAITPLPSVSISKVPISAVFDSSKVEYAIKDKTEESLLPVHQHTETISSEGKTIQTSSVKNTSLTLPGCGYLKVIDILNKTYILAVSDIGLVVIDQHAAHERIIFERLLKDFSKSKLQQELLIPVTLDLSRMELQLLRKHTNAFSNIGFGIDFFSENTVMIHCVPSSIKTENISGLISNLLDSLIEQNSSGNKVDETVVAKVACTLAVKANDELSILEANKLISDLSKCDLPFNCPHGRPTVINISIKELEKRFGRVL